MEGLDHAFGFELTPTEGGPATGPWPDLARAVGAEDGSIGGAELATAINQSSNRFTIGPAVYAALRELILDPPYHPEGPAQYYERAGALISGLDVDILASALANQTNLGDRKKLVTTAYGVVSPAAVHALTLASGAAYERPVSDVLNALLTELKQKSESLPESVRPKADAAFRSLCKDIVETWSSATVDTSATGYEHLFEEVPEIAVAEAVAPEPSRIVQLALEIGAVGGVVWGAISEMSKGDGMRELLGMLKSAPADSKAANMIAQQFANPQRLQGLLREEEVDFNAVDALLRHMGMNATETLLDELVSSHSRAVRRGILDRLVALGPSVGPLVMERLKDERWFVLRNMLHVLNETGADLSQINLPAYQNHSDPRVRREAMALLYKDPIGRDRALANALKDTDPYMIRSALKAARNGLPDVAVPILAKRIQEPDFPPEFRVPSIHLLGRSKSVLALDALLKYTQGGTTLMGKPKLANKSPEMLAALKGLARTWPQERRAKPLLELAAATNDAQIKAALEATQSARDVELEDESAA